MSNHQADDLYIETLGRSDNSRAMLSLKPLSIKPKQIKDIKRGTLIEGFDPYNLRIYRGDRIVARAKLGRIGDKEALYIVSSQTEEPKYNIGSKAKLLECRVSFLPDAEFAKGDVLEFDEPLSQKLLILLDGKPIALGKVVEYDDEAWVYVERELA